MNLKQFKWILGGSYNIIKVIHCYAIDYLSYPQHLKAKIQEISLLLNIACSHEFRFDKGKKHGEKLGDRANKAVLYQLEQGIQKDIGQTVVCMHCGLKATLWEKDLQ